MKLLKVILLLLSSVFLVHCNLFNADGNSNNYNIPLKIGNSWQYKYTFTTPNPEAPFYTDNLNMVVDSVVYSPDNVETYRLFSWFDKEYEHNEYCYNYLQQTSDGIYEYGYQGVGPAIPWKKNVKVPLSLFGHSLHNDSKYPVWFPLAQKLLPTNPQINDSWIYAPLESTIPSTHTIYSFERITVPAGTFNCVVKKIVFNDPDFNSLISDYKIYYSSIGIVKAMFDFGIVDQIDAEGNSVTYHSYMLYELKNYRIN
jgi:hypothetical protein